MDEQQQRESLLSNLPFNLIHKDPLATTPGTVSAAEDPSSLVCGPCWDTVFSSDDFAKACWGLSKPYESPFRYQVRLRRVEKAARRGYSWCQLILNVGTDGYGLLKDEPPNTDLGITFSLDEPNREQTPKGCNLFTLWVNQYWGRVSGFTARDDVAFKFVKSGKLQNEVGTEAAFTQARAWIKGCSYHERCREPQKVPLPSRVIEVSPESSPGKPRLLLGNDLMGNYAALSYCWGMGKTGMTTSKSLSSQLLELDTKELSRTVKDAILCTRNLKLKYLWVDAICILQDSDEDKRNEMAKMLSIYRDANVTIVAASAENATKGFLEDRPPPKPSYRVPFPCPNNRIGTISLSREHLDYHWHGTEPVNLRAWTLQEALISPRLLLYSSHTLQLHRQTSTINLGDSLNVGAGTFRLESYLFQLQRRKIALNPERVREILDHWEWVVSEYTRRELTNTNDKLIALAGIAELFANVLRTKYVAGLWEAHLLRQITWGVDKRKHRPKTYRAPSWCWTAIDGYIWYNFSNDRVPYRCRVIKCDTTPLEPSARFGSVKSGELTIKGPIRTAWFTTPDVITWDEPTPIDPVTPKLASQHENSDSEDFPSPEPHRDLYGTLDSIDDESTSPVLVHCLAIDLRFGRLDKLQEYGEKVYVDGLVLLPHDDEKTTFRRIAVFRGGKKADFASCKRQIITIV